MCLLGTEQEREDIHLRDLKLPDDLRQLELKQCERLCGEIREILIATVSQNGGHLASNLGVVELTMAIHRAFHSPKDKIVWDVSHQSYTHKILTGRLDRFGTLRRKNGLSGFARPSESRHDAFVGGHASTAVSAALGYASAMKIKGDHRHYAVAVVGDGAATGGMFFEGLNNAGKSKSNIIVILNHNEMSISKNVGGFAKYLTTLRTSEGYIRTKGVVESLLNSTPLVGKPIANTIRASKNALKDAIIHSSTLFEDMGFEYIGPVDGHNLSELETALKSAKAMHKPVIVHVNTVKGRGYPPAEANSGEFHAVGSFEIATGNPDVTPGDSFSGEFGSTLCELACEDRRLCAVTAAMKYATGLDSFAKRFPARFFDVGIAEEHAVTFCAGLASAGMRPVFAVYSTFLQRCYDQLIHDAAVSGTHIVLAVDRAGVVGGDGETHQGIFDVPLLTTIPTATVYSPSNYQELKCCLRKALYSDTGICAVRYPKGGCGCVRAEAGADAEYVYNKADGGSSDVLAVSYGRLSSSLAEACENLQNKGIRCDFLKLVKVFPFTDEEIRIISSYKDVVVFEECSYEGSIGQKLEKYARVHWTGVTPFMAQAEADELLEECGLTSPAMEEKLRRVIS